MRAATMRSIRWFRSGEVAPRGGAIKAAESPDDRMWLALLERAVAAGDSRRVRRRSAVVALAVTWVVPDEENAVAVDRVRGVALAGRDCRVAAAGCCFGALAVVVLVAWGLVSDDDWSVEGLLAAAGLCLIGEDLVAVTDDKAVAATDVPSASEADGIASDGVRLY